MGLFRKIILNPVKNELERRKIEKAAIEAELQETLPYKLSFQCTSTLFREKYDVTDQNGRPRYYLKTSRYRSEKPYLKLYRTDDNEEIVCIKAKCKTFKGWVFTLYEGKEKIGALTYKDCFREKRIVLSCLGCTIENEAHHLFVLNANREPLAEISSQYYVRYDAPNHRNTALLAFLFWWMLSLLEDKERMESEGIY